MTTEITATVLRSDIDSTNSGVSSTIRRVIIIGEFDELPEDPLFPVLRIKTRGDSKYLEPVTEVPEGHIGWMNGGNFAYTGDSRFRSQFNEYPIPIHDRSETYEEHSLLSR